MKNSDNKLYERLELTDRTVSSIVELLRASYTYDAYLIEKRIIILIRDYEEQSGYLLAMEKTKFDAVLCLLVSKNCGGGEQP